MTSFFFTYRSSEGDVIFNEAADGCIAPAIDYAYTIWNMLFKRYKRGSQGEIEENSICRYKEDSFSLALAAGESKVYFNGSLINMESECLILSNMDEIEEDHEFYGKAICRGDSFYAPFSLLGKVFGIEYEVIDLPNCSSWYNCKANNRITLDDFKIRFVYEEKTYELFSNISLIKVDGVLKNLKHPLLVIDGVIMFPVEELMSKLGYFSGLNNDVIYITDHYLCLGYTSARIIRENILNPRPDMKYYIAKAGINREFKISPNSVSAGESVNITADKRIKSVTAFMNGVKIPVWSTGNNIFEIYNIFGNVEVMVDF